jgi:hypothetical protein
MPSTPMMPTLPEVASLSADAHADGAVDLDAQPRELAAEPPAVDERRLAFGALRILAVLAPPVVGVAYYVAGWAGAISALIGLSFVLVLFGASAAILAWVSARPGVSSDPATGNGVGLMVLGATVRLPLYLVALVLLERVSWIHGRSLAAATGIAVAVTLAYELRLMAKMPRLFWVDAAAGRPSAAPNDTRSETL